MRVEEAGLSRLNAEVELRATLLNNRKGSRIAVHEADRKTEKVTVEPKCLAHVGNRDARRNSTKCRHIRSPLVRSTARPVARPRRADTAAIIATSGGDTKSPWMAAG